MAHSDLTPDAAESLPAPRHADDLFSGDWAVPVAEWLSGTPARAMQLALIGEEARSEFIVGPISVSPG